ncbi:MAG TPA: isoprenoid biosynthesis glyoxalase ElbB [Bdellovibrionales bacterium]|nr:isoprenoid biosynthesis glyoxalase ElbB [Bdellovibrionales bacterium]
MKKIAVVLAGCGFKDGSEITEAVSALIALSEAGAEYKVFAPDMKIKAVDHIKFEKTGEERNVLQEAARIARGKIQNIRELTADAFDGLVMPGGFGAATNLCSWGSDGANAKVHPEVERVVRDFYQKQKPIAAICIAPAIVAKVLGSQGVTVTVGASSDTSKEIEKTGAVHEVCAVDDYVTDREHRIITTPAYMYGDAKPHQLFQGIRGAIRELVEMA